MHNSPFFSVVIPTYNRADLIPATVQTFLSQNYSHFEVLVIDDGSKDNTEYVIRQIKDPRLRYIKVTNGERGRARNIGTLQALGDYITFIDSDDLAYPQHLHEAATMIARLGQPEIFHLGYEMKDTSGKVLHQFNFARGNINQFLLKGNYFSCIGVFLRKDIAQANLFEEDRRLTGTEDWHLWLRLAARYPIHYNTIITSCMINHENRSVLNFKRNEMVDRTELLVHYLSQDSIFIKAFGAKVLDKIKAHMFTYIALHSVLAGNNSDGWDFFLKGLKLNTAEFMQRRSLAIIKYLLKNFFSKPAPPLS